MEASIAIERSIWIKATPERVWLALTDPEQVEQWFAPGTKFRSSGDGVGAKLYVEDPETGAEMYVQFLEVVDRPHHLVLKSDAVPPDPAFVTDYRLETEKDGTRLTMIYSGYEGLPEDMRQQLMDGNAAGFDLMMGNIKAFIEGTELPNPQGF